jgi:hypothetical protein
MKITGVGSTAGVRAPDAPKPASAKPTFLEVLRGADREVRGAAPPPTPPAPKPAAAKPELGRQLTQALDNVNKGEMKLDALLEAAAKGKTFSAGELLAMQATVFKYSQTVEVLSRATDRLVGAIKQTLGTQV